MTVKEYKSILREFIIYLEEKEAKALKDETEDVIESIDKDSRKYYSMRSEVRVNILPNLNKLKDEGLVEEIKDISCRPYIYDKDASKVLISTCKIVWESTDKIERELIKFIKLKERQAKKQWEKMAKRAELINIFSNFGEDLFRDN